MIGMAAIGTVCTIGIAFYLRFLLALWSEYRRGWIVYFVRFEPGKGGGDAVVKPQPEPEPAFREVTPVDLQCV